MKVIKTNILTPLKNKSLLYLTDQYLTIQDSKISDISSRCLAENFLDYSNTICVPGFIDLHVHLSQYNVRGKHATGLLDWLKEYIFAEEKKASDNQYANYLAGQFFTALLSNGTTTAVVYVAPFPEACDIAFQAAKKMGSRIIMGQTLMDRNCPEYLCRDTEQSLDEAISLYKKWHQATPLLEYIFTPRFAPVCSPELMKRIGRFASENNAYIQTHLSENKDEIELVRKLFPDCENYTDVYKRHDLLGEKTLLGHAIHVSDGELKTLRETNSKITHCPDSNFFLHSGSFPLKRVIDFGIDFGLGSDVGAGTTLYMPQIMKMFIYRQDVYRATLAEAFYYATLGAAKVLGKDQLIGSLEKGKEADLVFMQVPRDVKRNTEDILSYLTYLSSSEDVFATYIAGKECYTSTG